MKELLKKLDGWDEKHPIIDTIILSAILSLVIEMFNQRSAIGGLEFMFTSPAMFAVNMVIVLAVMSLTLFFKKRRCGMFVVSFIFMVLAISNYIIRTFRTTPLRALDLRVAKSVMNIVNMYFKPWHIVLGIVLIILLLAGIVFMWFKTRKIRPKYLKSLAAAAICIGLAAGTVAGASSTGLIPEHFDNLTNAYLDHGLVYCFTASLWDNGISKPDTYSEVNVELIREQNTSYKESSNQRPNIIYVQLESFFDMDKMKNFTYSEDPTPNFHALKKSWPHGKLTVASFGTGTSNTEFDVLTGMNVQFFGAGEYPYSTILRKKNCESIAFNLSELGYSTHAMHDHKGNFYARNKVYPRLGFDSFTSVEYMQNVEYNVLGWARDKILTSQIIETLDSTENEDFIFAVSVQPHGRYSEEVIDDTQTITMEGASSEGEKNAYEYYINQLHETDAFVKDLCDEMQKRKEHTIIVFYGDHLPNIGMTDEDLIDGVTIYDSEYIIWNNYGYKFENKDLASYQLSAWVTKSLGFENWEVANLHENYGYDLSNPDYLRDLKMVQYDVLYGKSYYYGEEFEEKPKQTEMTMGIREIAIDRVEQVGEDVHVFGKNFTEASVVSIAKDKKETEFISPEELIVRDVTLEVADTVRVYQMASARSWLSRTELDYYKLGPESLINEAEVNSRSAINNAKENDIDFD